MDSETETVSGSAASLEATAATADTQALITLAAQLLSRAGALSEQVARLWLEEARLAGLALAAFALSLLILLLVGVGTIITMAALLGWWLVQVGVPVAAALASVLAVQALLAAVIALWAERVLRRATFPRTRALLCNS